MLCCSTATCATKGSMRTFDARTTTATTTTTTTNTTNTTPTAAATSTSTTNTTTNTNTTKGSMRTEDVWSAASGSSACCSAGRPTVSKQVKSASLESRVMRRARAPAAVAGRSVAGALLWEYHAALSRQARPGKAQRASWSTAKTGTLTGLGGSRARRRARAAPEC